MDEVVFWDVDTQIDFIEPGGKLYVHGAEEIKDNLAALTKTSAGVRRLCGSVDAHFPEDPEFSEWPEHCVYGTSGQRKIPKSTANGVLFVPMAKLSTKQLQEVIGYKGQVIFEKQSTEVRTNPNVEPFLRSIRPSKVVVYGVVTEICVNLTVSYLARDLKYKTVVVSDAIKEIDASKADQCYVNWRAMGVEFLKTRDVIKTFSSRKGKN